MLVKRVEELVEYCTDKFKGVQVSYVGIYPRFLERCCQDSSHMTEDDIWLMHNNRSEIDRQIMSRIEKKCDIVQWWETLGMTREPELVQVRKGGVVSKDNVHLTREKCKSAAVSLCFRVVGAETVLMHEGQTGKRWCSWSCR